VGKKIFFGSLFGILILLGISYFIAQNQAKKNVEEALDKRKQALAAQGDLTYGSISVDFFEETATVQDIKFIEKAIEGQKPFEMTIKETQASLDNGNIGFMHLKDIQAHYPEDSTLMRVATIDVKDLKTKKGMDKIVTIEDFTRYLSTLTMESFVLNDLEIRHEERQDEGHFKLGVFSVMGAQQGKIDNIALKAISLTGSNNLKEISSETVTIKTLDLRSLADIHDEEALLTAFADSFGLEEFLVEGSRFVVGREDQGQAKDIVVTLGSLGQINHKREKGFVTQQSVFLKDIDVALADLAGQSPEFQTFIEGLEQETLSLSLKIESDVKIEEELFTLAPFEITADGLGVLKLEVGFAGVSTEVLKKLSLGDQMALFDPNIKLAKARLIYEDQKLADHIIDKIAEKENQSREAVIEMSTGQVGMMVGMQDPLMAPMVVEAVEGFLTHANMFEISLTPETPVSMIDFQKASAMGTLKDTLNISVTGK